MQPGMFLDLNRTLVEPVKPELLDDLIVIPGVVEAVARLSAGGLVCQDLPSSLVPTLCCLMNNLLAFTSRKGRQRSCASNADRQQIRCHGL
jgi:hypothetical protein